MAIVEACEKLIWLKELYVEFCGVDSCINLFSDSQSAIYLTKDQMFHDRQITLRSSTIMFEIETEPPKLTPYYRINHSFWSLRNNTELTSCLCRVKPGKSLITKD
jgi:hypothetical protein